MPQPNVQIPNKVQIQVTSTEWPWRSADDKEKLTTYNEPPAAGPIVLKSDIEDIEMPFAAPLCSWDWS